MRDKYGVTQDPYCYQGTDTLINLLDIHDPGELELAERDLTEAAIERIAFSEPPYDIDYLKAVHKALFADLYDWAGELRTVDIAIGSSRFCTASRIHAEGTRLFGELAAELFLVDLPREQLVARAAHFYSEINVLHPFRDGNGRAQRILFEHIILNCGYELSWAGISREEWLNANVEAYSGRLDQLAALFGRAIGRELRELEEM